MTLSVYQRVLGPDFDRLSPELQRYFGAPDAGSVGRGTGVFEVAGATKPWLRPAFAFLAWRRILFPEHGEDVPFTVVNRPGIDGSLSAVRSFRLPGRERVMEDTMRVVNGGLHDFLGRRRGLEVRLALKVSRDGQLRMMSERAWVHFRGARIRLPALLSVRVELLESWDGEAQRVEVTMRHPLFGTVFEYRGRFEYDWVVGI